MADRYLRASGNWNGSVWAATSSGAAGSASTPTADDSVYIAANFTVTLTADAVCYILRHNSGRINIGSNKLTCEVSYESTGTVARTLDMGSGIMEVGPLVGVIEMYRLEGSNMTLIAGTSKLVLNNSTISWARNFRTLSKTFNDVIINLDSSFSSTTTNITGSPTFRSLTIQSKNSAAHTVNMEVDSIIQTDKLILLGSNTSNRLTVNGGQNEARISVKNGGSSYGQFVYMNVLGDPFTESPKYIGSNSVNGPYAAYWLLQDPPKISTLQDEFTSLSSSRWATQAVGSGYINASGGTLNMGWSGGSAYTRITTKDTYDLVDEIAYIKVLSSDGELFLSVLPVASHGGESLAVRTELITSGERFWRVESTVSGDDATLTFAWYDSGTWVTTHTQTVPQEQLRSVRLQIDGTRNMSAASLVVESVGYGPFPTQPIADFSATPTSGLRPVTVNFTDLTKGIPDTWSWSFGDGYSSTQQNPSHPYSKAGTYTVTLTASNSVGSDTETKTGFVVISPEIFTRTAGGTMVFSGTTSRKLLASRTAEGTMVFGGSTRAIIIRDAETLQDKVYLYKVYDPDGNYVETWKDVASELAFTHEINSIGSTTAVELARNSDTVGTTTSPLQDHTVASILTHDNQPILATTESRNQVGSGSSVDYNNRVDIIAYYGSVEPILTHMGEEILTHDDEPILASVGAPNGRRVFTGFISEINSRYGNSETTVVQLTSYGFDLDQFPVTTAYNNNVTTVPFNSYDPSTIVSTAIDRFAQAAALEQVSYTVRTTESISLSGTVVSYTFRNNTYKELLDKTLELLPSNWYYRIGLGDNTVYIRERSTTADHIFYLGKHIKALDLKGSILDVTNHTLFTGGGDPALYVEHKETPASRTRRGLQVLSDSRVILEDSADIISEGKIDEGNKLQYRTTVEILTKQYDIENVSVGQTVGFRNFGNYVDSLVLQIVGLSYTPDVLQLQLETKPLTINKRLEDVYRNLKVTENIDTPTTPV